MSVQQKLNCSEIIIAFYTERKFQTKLDRLSETTMHIISYLCETTLNDITDKFCLIITCALLHVRVAWC